MELAEPRQVRVQLGDQFGLDLSSRVGARGDLHIAQSPLQSPDHAVEGGERELAKRLYLENLKYNFWIL